MSQQHGVDACGELGGAANGSIPPLHFTQHFTRPDTHDSNFTMLVDLAPCSSRDAQSMIMVMTAPWRAARESTPEH